ncbi:3-hydroxyisobutyrate dehydrogenase [Pigmentiphaga soli]|uniref:3-hydroxyisobutyrate dehydrogenase n=1 Tax=Pigmentiphaga soli TaxID=1007095 RepID=A0ABP8GGJ1_9BURK
METANRPLLGMIGLGNAGMALATALLRHFDLAGYDRDAGRCAVGREAGVRVAASAAQVVAAAQIVFLCLPTPEASRAAAAAMAEGPLQGRLIVECSTVSPDDVDWLSGFLAGHGATAVDSAIVGGVHRLSEGRTTFLLGASAVDHERVRPVLERVAEKIFYLGPAGSGMRAKVINNAVAHTTMVMLLETAAMCVKAGLPVELFFELMRRDSGLSRPLTHRLGERVFRQDFEGGMSTANARKDSALALEMARSMGVPLFTVQAAHSVYEVAMGEDLGALDYASISRLWERWLDISLAPAAGGR